MSKLIKMYYNCTIFGCASEDIYADFFMVFIDLILLIWYNKVVGG